MLYKMSNKSIGFLDFLFFILRYYSTLCGITRHYAVSLDFVYRKASFQVVFQIQKTSLRTHLKDNNNGGISRLSENVLLYRTCRVVVFFQKYIDIFLNKSQKIFSIHKKGKCQ